METRFYKAKKEKRQVNQRKSTETCRILGPEEAWRCHLDQSPALGPDSDYPKGLLALDLTPTRLFPIFREEFTSQMEAP